MSSTTDNVRTNLEAIRDEHTTHANTATRIGDALLSLLQLIEQGIDASKFLRRDIDDVAAGTIRFAKGVNIGKDASLTISADGIATLKEIVSQVFSSGALGTGFRLGAYGDTGDSYLEVDRLLVRKAAEFVKLVIRELQSVGGEIILTPAAMKCTGVMAYDKKGAMVLRPQDAWYYRCFFRQEVDGEEVTNDFAVDDLVRCQTFNIQEGTTSGAKNRYYWRRCVGVGKNYIDLSATDCDTGSDVPQAGDEMVQLGNPTDETRQSAIILSAYGDDAPSMKFYRGIVYYDFIDKEVVVISRKEVSIIADKLRYRTSSGTYAGVDEQINSVKTTANDAKNKAEGLEDAIEDISDEVATVSDKYASLSVDVDGIRTEVGAQRTYVDGQVDNLKTTITQTEDRLSLKVEQTRSDIEDEMKATGIDIENGKITATADKFEVRNNNGDTTASVNAKGVLEVNSGLFTGFVKKKPTVITPDNLDFYKSTRQLQAGYIEIDFDKAGSFLVFQGDFSTKLGSDYIALLLPFTGSSWTTADYADTEHPLAYIGQRFVLVNQSTKSVRLQGGGTIQKRGTATAGQDNDLIGRGEVAVIECALTTSYSTSGNTYKATWNGAIYRQ